MYATTALMKHPGVATILAAGGNAMVVAAYSCGKPALGVGAGKVPAYVEKTCVLKRVVKFPKLGKKAQLICIPTTSGTRIVVHNTANDASARNEISYMISNNNQVSFHFAVDDKEVVQGIPLNRNAWHSGDGGNGKGNREGIAIEICYSKSGGTRFTNAEKLASKFIAQLLKERGWDISKVTKHQDYNGKYCPHRTLDMGWQRFLNMVQDELNTLKGVQSNSASTTSNGKLEDYSGYVEVIYAGSDGLDYHSSPSWDSKTVAGTAKKGDVFTVVGRIMVDGTYMYKLKSGNYITSASKYVTFRTTLHSSSSATSSSSQTNKYAGKEVKLSKKPLYASSDAKSASGSLTGTYYYWSDEIINGRIRVTNAKSRVGVKRQITGWISI